MRILIISDIHSNFVALQAVLKDAGSYDKVWCLGDTIGYGPEPNECCVAMREQAEIIISGNHDLACIGVIDLDDFNHDARVANIWNRNQLKPEYHEWLKQLEPMQTVDKQFTVAHASPREPVWEYLLSPEQAIANFAFFNTQVCLIGHSHVQLCFRLSADSQCERFLPDSMRVVDLSKGNRFFINPGSVGQPRDYDPRAAYAILDTSAGTVSFQRVAYDIPATQRKMDAAHLPVNLIRRLDFGM